MGWRIRKRLVVLLLAALSLLVALTFHYRSARMQAEVEANAATAADQLVQLLERNLQAILALPGRATPSETWQHHAQELLLADPTEAALLAILADYPRVVAQAAILRELFTYRERQSERADRAELQRKLQ